MKKLIFALLLSFSAFCQNAISVSDSMFVGFKRPDGVFVIYDAKGVVTVQDGFALKLETSDLKLSKFLSITDFYGTLDEARAKLGLSPITQGYVKDKDKNFDDANIDCLNCSDDWQRYCPVQIAVTHYKKPTGETFNYQHATHAILNIQELANKGYQAKCSLKVEGVESGIVYVITDQKMGAIRNDMNGFNQYGNNHPMNRYGVGLNNDCVLKLPKNENLRFTWHNTGNANILVWLHHPNPDPQNHLDYRECISPNEERSFIYNPRQYLNGNSGHEELKSNMNADHSCNRL